MNRHPRAAFTLRELMFALTVGSSVMMTSMAMIHRSMNEASAARRQRNDDRQFFAFSRQIRDDIHLASKATLVQENADNYQLTLQFQDETTAVYHCTNDLILRDSLQGQRQISQQQFRWQQPKQLTVELSDEPQMVTLTLFRVPTTIQGQAIPHSEALPIWRQLQLTSGLRLKHVAGEIQP